MPGGAADASSNSAGSSASAAGDPAPGSPPGSDGAVDGDAALILQSAAAKRKFSLSCKISELKEQKAQAALARRIAARDLRNAERRRRRLKKKAKELPPNDLIEIMALQEEQKQKSKSGAKGRASVHEDAAEARTAMSISVRPGINMSLSVNIAHSLNHCIMVGIG